MVNQKNDIELQTAKTFTIKSCKCGLLFYQGKSQILHEGDIIEVSDISCGKCIFCRNVIDKNRSNLGNKR